MPQFSVDLQTALVLTSSIQPTYLRLLDLSIAESEYPNYNFEWTITPELPADAYNLTLGGTQIKIESGFWQSNTDYSVSCTVTHKTLPEIFTFTNSTAFNTSSPPYGGSIVANPDAAYVGDMVTIDIVGW